MNETRHSVEHGQHGSQAGGHGGGVNTMGLLMAVGTAAIVAVLLVPSIGLLFGIGAGLLAGAWMFAMHGGAMGGHGGHGGQGGGHRHGC
jgi:hypothetical protein